MLDSALEKEEVDWIATTAYYSRYFVIYALFQKAGIKCEIHDCTISLMYFLLVEEKIIEEKFYQELQAAKKIRVDLQYYVTEQIDKEKLKKDGGTARDFVLKMEEVIENIKEEQIRVMREKIRNIDSKKEEFTQ